MPDAWERERPQPVAVGPPRRRLSRAQRMREARRRRRRRIVRSVTLCVFILIVVGAVFLGSRLWHTVFGGPGSDYSGDGKSDVVIQVHDGDSTTAIGKTLEEHEVVATSKAFVAAAQGNSAIQSIQPGFYKMRTEIPAASAVARLADPANRVGKLVIPEGRQLDDIRDVKTNAVTEGIFTLISNATCVDLDGDRHCVSADDLRAADTAIVEVPSLSAVREAHSRQARLHLRCSMDVIGWCPRFGGIDSFRTARPGLLACHRGRCVLGISKNSNLVHGMFSPAGPADQAIRYLAGLVRVADGSAGQMTGATGVPQLADWQGSRNPKADFGVSTCWFD